MHKDFVGFFSLDPGLLLQTQSHDELFKAENSGIVRIWLGQELAPYWLNSGDVDVDVDISNVSKGFDSLVDHIADGGDDNRACFVLMVLPHRNTDFVEDR